MVLSTFATVVRKLEENFNSNLLNEKIAITLTLSYEKLST
jgi:hypothetical protein